MFVGHVLPRTIDIIPEHAGDGASDTVPPLALLERLTGIIVIAVIGIYGTVKRSRIGVYASLGLAMVFLVVGGWAAGTGDSVLGAVLAVLGVALVVAGVATRRHQPQ